MTRYGAWARTLPAAIAFVLLAGNVLAQQSSDRDWRALQLQTACGRTPRVTVRTAAGKATGTLRAVEADRLIFGDRASQPMIVARSEICEIATSSLPRPRTQIVSMAIGATAVVAGKRARIGKVGLFFVALGIAMAYDRNVPGPSYLRYSDPGACPLPSSGVEPARRRSSHHVIRRVEHMTRYEASARRLLTAVACALLAADSLHAQRSPNEDWAILQLYTAGRYKTRVTVRTAAGEATGTLGAVEADRLIFGDRASHPMILARDEICQVSTSKHLSRPRTEAISLAIAGGLIAAATVLVKGVATGGRIFGALGLSYVVASTTTRPVRVLYSNPKACPP